MLEKTKNYIAIIFYLAFFSIPLVFHPQTSELFEFNKMILTYALTVVIVCFWFIRMILEKKIVFRRTILDIPLLIFLTSQTLSTLISIDARTSLLGYYSRFHGGLISSYSYSLLYWAFVSNMRYNTVVKSIRILFISTFLVSIWAIFEHFGHSFSCLLVPEFGTFDVSCWVQDVQSRVYATLGQPNWLAAWIVAIIPLTWALALNPKSQIPNSKQISNYKLLNKLLWILLSSIFFITLLYTKSRSGILAFALAFLLFWAFSFLLSSFNKIHTTGAKKLIVNYFLIVLLTTITIAFSVGTPWTPNLMELVNNDKLITNNQSQITLPGPALEVGGSSSAEIRKIVWKGAVEIWKHYPILGTGVETFAFSYYNYRPVEHNLVSEWDFLYNKAHNEYLNFAATTGTVGLLSYLTLIVSTLLLFVKYLKFNLSIALLSGYVSILVTNFFGFSVVPVALLFFLFPAIAVSLNQEPGATNLEPNKKETIDSSQKVIMGVILLATCYVLFATAKYWYGDFLYARGKLQNDSQEYIKAQSTLTAAAKLSPNESIYHGELADVTATLALIASEEGNVDFAKKFAEIAFKESDTAAGLSPHNITLKRDRANMFIRLSITNPIFLINARDTLIEAVKLAPTEAKLFYNLGVAYLRTGDYEKASETIQKTIEMKPNYKEAHYALALMYIDKGEKEKAREELNYILTNISPDDTNIKRELDELQ